MPRNAPDNLEALFCLLGISTGVCVPGTQTNSPICRFFEAGARGTIWTANLVEAVQATPHTHPFSNDFVISTSSPSCVPLLLKETLTYRSVKSRRTRISLLVRMIFLDMCTTATTLQMQLPTDSGRPYRRSGLSFFLSTTGRCRSVGNGLKFFCNLHTTSFQHSAQDGAFTKPVLDATQPPTDEFANRLAGAQPPRPFQTWSLECLDETARRPLCFFGWGLMRMLPVWAATLKWPSQTSEQLYIHFIMSTGHRIPINSGTPKRPHYVLYHDHPGAKAVPRPYNVEILDWIFCVDIYKRLMDRPLFPFATSSEVLLCGTFGVRTSLRVLWCGRTCPTTNLSLSKCSISGAIQGPSTGLDSIGFRTYLVYLECCGSTLRATPPKISSGRKLPG